MSTVTTMEESEPIPIQVVNEKLYIAVGKDTEEYKPLFEWALRYINGRKLCILHVHEPDQWVRTALDAIEHLSEEAARGIKDHRERETQKMNKVLRDYRISSAGVVGVVHIENNSIEKGIVELINQHGIRKLVMGAAADTHPSMEMAEPRSKKAIYVCRHAPTFCHIRFVCKGQRFRTREGASEGVTTSPNFESEQSICGRSQSIPDLPVNQLNSTNSSPMGRASNFSVCDPKVVTSHSSSGTVDLLETSRSPSSTSTTSCSSVDMADVSASIPVFTIDHDDQFSSPPVISEQCMNDKIYDQLEQFIAEAEASRREAFDESTRRRKDAIDAFRRESENLYAEEVRQRKEVEEALARGKEELEQRKRQVGEVTEELRIALENKSSLESQIANSEQMVKDLEESENLYAEEVRQRKEVEEALARGKEELEQRKRQVGVVTEELRIALENKSSLESQIANSEQMVKDLEQKMFSAVELLQKYKKERDELQKERDNALKEAEELRREKAGMAANVLAPEIFSEVSFPELLEATSNFDASLKIGAGGYGSIYKGFLRHTQVAIKTLDSNSMQGPSEFQQEVTVLSKLRHPNLVTLIGSCPEYFILVYEYLPNGSLEDRLCCKDNSPPLSWQTRIHIATELCSALIFLHSCKPYGIVHGDLKPANILLDSNCVSKLSDFGICRVLGQNQFSSNNTTPCWITECPKGTFTYMDPEFLATGELTPKSDVYSFGIILLRLLTGKPALGIAKEVKYAVDKGNLENLLDPTAGGWPFVQARRLALVALRCCEMNRENRPDLALDVWRELKCMSVSCGTSPFFTNSVEDCQIPPYFICPIFQETMRDPHMAADGYTYEVEAIKGWLDGDRDTSPMTNVKLPHCNIVPNHALRSAILEWRQQHNDE